MSILEIYKRLLALQDSKDTEMAHGEADELLIELILRLDKAPNDTSITMGAIIDAYYGIRKWYA